MAERLYHMGLTVTDIRRSYDFYHDLAGMEINLAAASEESETEDIGGVEFFIARSETFAKMTHNPGCEIKYAYLQTADNNFTLQIIQYIVGGGEPAPLEHNRAGSPHLCFFVDDINEKLRQCEEHGAKITSELVHFPPNLHNFYAEDPDGMPVEFIELR